MPNDNKYIHPSDDESQIVLYQPDESIRLEVKVEGETVWLTQAQMTELFRTTRNNITMHIRNIFREGELEEKSVCKESLRTAGDGKNYRTKIYNLDVIISVGYRVKNPIGTRFRQWANAVIKQYLLQGYSVNRHLIALQENMDKHDRLFPEAHIEIRKWRKESHDRWLVIDDALYHCGHSLNANGGHKISAITLMGTSPEMILAEVSD